MNGDLETAALDFFSSGHNCAESVIMAAGAVYGFDGDEGITNMCSAVAHGMGVGCFCGALLAGVMTLGRMFDPATAKRLRIRLLWGFREEFPCFDCHALKYQDPSGGGCEGVLRCVCRIVSGLVDEERSRQRNGWDAAQKFMLL